MGRYKIELEYDGGAYHGWQLQPDAETVQGALERALATVLRSPVRVSAAGRTDAGVHALGQVASFSTAGTIDPAVLLKSLNALLRPHAAVRSIERAADDFDPRRDALSRLYEYRIWNEGRPSPFWRRYSWHVPRRLDLAVMSAAAASLLGEHDFSAFRAAGCESASAVRRVLRSEVEACGGFRIYRIEANAFVRGMVRSIVGTLVRVGLGEMRPCEFADVLTSRDRRRAGPTAPARGLFLVSVRY